MLNWREGRLRFADDLAFLSDPAEIKSDLKKGGNAVSDRNSPLFAELAQVPTNTKAKLYSN